LTELVGLKRFIGTVTEKCPSRLTARNTRTCSHPSPKVTKTQRIVTHGFKLRNSG
jgi:hypothetical protein